MNNQEFRDNFKKQEAETTATVDKHYETLCAIAKDFCEHGRFQVMTPYGYFSFTPEPNFSYKI